MQEKTVDALCTAVSKAKNIVFFGGAGVSTESGIPDFRGANGLYKQNAEIPPDKIQSGIFFQTHPDDFYSFYRARILAYQAEPNIAHKKLAELEQQGKLKAVITQNIDGLHQAAGSKNVMELHGSIHRNHCTRCRKFYSLDAVRASEGVPRCTFCGGIIKPDITLYGGPVNTRLLKKAERCIRAADLLIIAGTSLAVQPAMGLIHAFQGETLAVINRGTTPLDARADIRLYENIGTVFSVL